MLRAQKKLTKRQIKEDRFVTFYFRAQDFLQRHSRNILYAVGAVAAIVLIVFIFQSKQAEKERNAIVELTKAKIRYFETDYDAAIPILTNLVEQYGGTDSAQEGTFYLANAHFQVGNYVEAEKYFTRFLENDGDDILSASAMTGIAACLEEQQNYEKAAELYKESADKYAENFMAPQNLYDSARCYALSGKIDEARQTLSKLLEKYEDATIRSDAEILLSELSS